MLKTLKLVLAIAVFTFLSYSSSGQSKVVRKVLANGDTVVMMDIATYRAVREIMTGKDTIIINQELALAQSDSIIESLSAQIAYQKAAILRKDLVLKEIIAKTEQIIAIVKVPPQKVVPWYKRNGSWLCIGAGIFAGLLIN